MTDVKECRWCGGRNVPAAALRWDPERRAFVEIETMNGRPVLEGGRVVVKQAFPKRGQ
jgi:hypothetical protein